MKHTISLNGTWLIDYLSNAPYVDTVEPEILLPPSKESATPCNVPGYWEDMSELFRTTSLHYKLQWNPLYTLQRYPQTGYCPDMVLPNPVGCFVYRKDITLDTVPDVETELAFGGVQNAVSAWINGHYLGRHEGYSAPFSFPIPKGILRLGENRIMLAVSNIRLIGYIERICKRIKNHYPDTTVIFATSTSAQSERMLKDFKRYNEEIEAYNDVAVSIVKKYGFAVNDLYALSASLPDEAHSDPVHYNTPAATRAFTDQIIASIAPALGITEEVTYKEALFVGKPSGI